MQLKLQLKICHTESMVPPSAVEASLSKTWAKSWSRPQQQKFEDVSDKIRTYHAQATISNHCTYQLLSNTNILPAPQKSRQCKGQSNNIQRSVKVSKHMSLELPLQSAELQCKARRFFAQTFPIPVIGTQSP